MPSRVSPTTWLALAALLCAAVLALTACEDGEGLHDEGPSGPSPRGAAPYEEGSSPAGRQADPPSGNS
ncbi:hypothetical protein ACIPPJ_19720 [Streptomyces sp. NPDC086091]|uniref:hypothetical protein n=1 Tax=Streptomyces sp. NPDC086091 TaxID=3365751 RepID=UPI0037F4C230